MNTSLCISSTNMKAACKEKENDLPPFSVDENVGVGLEYNEKNS
jgi:hypothetical protein